jgi:hypothetical protein
MKCTLNLALQPRMSFALLFDGWEVCKKVYKVKGIVPKRVHFRRILPFSTQDF